jgi:hypothetical protein
MPEWSCSYSSSRSKRRHSGRAPDPFDFIVDETGMELFEKLISLAESEGIDYGP